MYIKKSKRSKRSNRSKRSKRSKRSNRRRIKRRKTIKRKYRRTKRKNTKIKGGAEAASVAEGAAGPGDEPPVIGPPLQVSGFAPMREIKADQILYKCLAPAGSNPRDWLKYLAQGNTLDNFICSNF